MNKLVEQSVRKYFDEKGIELLDTLKDEVFDFAVMDGSAIVFVAVFAQEGKVPLELSPSRDEAEECAARYFTTHSIKSGAVRFDTLSVNILDKKKFLLRHHKDVLAA